MARCAPKTEHIHIVCSPDVKSMANDLAANEGESLGTAIRKLIREAHVAKFGMTKLHGTEGAAG